LKIGFVKNGKSFLPEVSAYVAYLNQQDNIEAITILTAEINDLPMTNIDLLWKFPGLDIKKYSRETKIIHEYNSLSTGHFAMLKNYVKKTCNVKPHGRIFLNELVEKEFKMKNNVPKIHRDMGISKDFFIKTSKKEYDFVYVGAMGSGRGTADALKPFTTTLKDNTILLIGNPTNELYKSFKDYKNIIFSGALPYHEVPLLASKAEYGLNYMPDVYPFNLQASTKLLEYCALDLKIVTTDYTWVNNFERKTQGRFFKLQRNLANLTMTNLNSFEFVTPDVSYLEWNLLLERVKLMEFIKLVME